MVDTHKHGLLSRLSLSRNASVASERRPPGGLRWLAVLAALAAVAACAYVSAMGEREFVDASDEAQPEAAQTSRAAEPGIERTDTRRPPARSAAALQATGHVVARQAATVSARTTAAVSRVFVDEASYVEARQVMAQLDDKVKRAQYELAVSERAVATSRVAQVAFQFVVTQQALALAAALAVGLGLLGGLFPGIGAVRRYLPGALRGA